MPVLISWRHRSAARGILPEVLPHAIEAFESPERAAMNVLAGIMLFLLF